jgi:hypothetical protein
MMILLGIDILPLYLVQYLIFAKISMDYMYEKKALFPKTFAG